MKKVCEACGAGLKEEDYCCPECGELIEEE